MHLHPKKKREMRLARQRSNRAFPRKRESFSNGDSLRFIRVKELLSVCAYEIVIEFDDDDT